MDACMPRFMVERTFPKGLHIPTNASGAEACLTVVERNAKNGVTWVHSYVSADKEKTFCIYDGPDEAAIRDAAKENGLPVDAVTRISVLDPYFYQD
jgi:hypothetical protein